MVCSGDKKEEASGNKRAVPAYGIFLSKALQIKKNTLQAENEGLAAKVKDKDDKIQRLGSQAADLRDALNADMQKLQDGARDNEEFRRAVMDKNSGE